MFFLFLYIFFEFSFFKKVPLTAPMTPNSPEISSELNKNININFYSLRVFEFKSDYKNYEQNSIEENNYKVLSPTLYIIILLGSIPIIILLIVLLVPSKKISDNLIAFDLDKNKTKNKKQNLGIQQKPNYFKLDDDNL